MTIDLRFPLIQTFNRNNFFEHLLISNINVFLLIAQITMQISLQSDIARYIQILSTITTTVPVLLKSRPIQTCHCAGSVALDSYHLAGSGSVSKTKNTKGNRIWIRIKIICGSDTPNKPSMISLHLVFILFLFQEYPLLVGVGVSVPVLLLLAFLYLIK